MECLEAKTNNQMEYAKEEKQLAEKYGVEPKTVRLITTIVDNRLAQNQRENREVEAKSTSQDTEQPTTGVLCLDQLIDRAATESQAMALVCMELSWTNNTLGDKIMAVLRDRTECFRAGESVEGYDLECDVVPAYRWLQLLNGLKLATLTETEAREL